MQQNMEIQSGFALSTDRSTNRQDVKRPRNKNRNTGQLKACFQTASLNFINPCYFDGKATKCSMSRRIPIGSPIP
jgi:hypothetical protein